jgi:hypothetical protein
MASIRKRTNPSGKTVWRAEIRRRGFAPLSETFPTRALAQEWSRKEERHLDEQRADPTAVGRQYLIDQAIARYRDDILPRKRPSTAYSQDQQLTWWLHQLSGKRLASITGPIVADCLHSLTIEDSGITGRPRSAATRNRYFAVINHVLNACVE